MAWDWKNWAKPGGYADVGPGAEAMKNNFVKADDPNGGTYFDNAMAANRNTMAWAQQGMDASAADPNAWMRNFLASEPGLAQISQDRTSALGQSLEALARIRAAQGGEAALAAMPGARNSGAGMAAYGQAYANPFAEALAQQQAQQLGLYGNLTNQSMGIYGQRDAQLQALYAQLYGQGLGGQTGLAGQSADFYQPTMEYQKSGLEQTLDWAIPIAAAALPMLAG